MLNIFCALMKSKRRAGTARRLVAATAVVAVLAACGVGSDDADRPFEVDNLPGAPFPTTTVVLTAPTSSLPLTFPPTSVTQVEPPPSTQPLYPLKVYFVSGNGLFPADRPLPGEPGLDDVERLLWAGPGANEANMNPLNYVTPGVVRSISVLNGVARFELLPGFFETLTAGQQVLMVGQIVLSARIPDVGQWAFELAGERVDIITADGRLAPIVTPADYRDLVIGGRLSPVLPADPAFGSTLAAAVPTLPPAELGGVDAPDDPTPAGAGRSSSPGNTVSGIATVPLTIAVPAASQVETTSAAASAPLSVGAPVARPSGSLAIAR